MLKIKNDVDLKELEKFRFEREFDKDMQEYTEYKNIIDDIEITIDYNRNIYIWGEDSCCIRCNQLCIDEGLTPLYDLIKADLVEKVEEK